MIRLGVLKSPVRQLPTSPDSVTTPSRTGRTMPWLVTEKLCRIFSNSDPSLDALDTQNLVIILRNPDGHSKSFRAEVIKELIKRAMTRDEPEMDANAVHKFRVKHARILYNFVFGNNPLPKDILDQTKEILFETCVESPLFFNFISHISIKDYKAQQPECHERFLSFADCVQRKSLESTPSWQVTDKLKKRFADRPSLLDGINTFQLIRALRHPNCTQEGKRAQIINELIRRTMTDELEGMEASDIHNYRKDNARQLYRMAFGEFRLPEPFLGQLKNDLFHSCTESPLFFSFIAEISLTFFAKEYPNSHARFLEFATEAYHALSQQDQRGHERDNLNIHLGIIRSMLWPVKSSEEFKTGMSEPHKTSPGFRFDLTTKKISPIDILRARPAEVPTGLPATLGKGRMTATGKPSSLPMTEPARGNMLQVTRPPQAPTHIRRLPSGPHRAQYRSTFSALRADTEPYARHQPLSLGLDDNESGIKKAGSVAPHPSDSEDSWE